MTEPINILTELLQAVEAYDEKFPHEIEVGSISPEHEKYWDAKDKAREYLAKVNSVNDDLASPSKSYHFKHSENGNSFAE